MNEIIVFNSSSRGTESKNLSKTSVEGMIIDLQIMTKIKNLLGENVPGIKFEAAEVDFNSRERRRIKKMASQDLHWWAEFIPIDDEGNYLLLIPSLKIVDDKIKALSNDEILACLCQAEKYVAEHPRETEKRMKKNEKKNRDVIKKTKDKKKKFDSSSGNGKEKEKPDQQEENSKSKNEELENEVSRS